MESSDNKTPPRPASGRPSLLSNAAANTPDKNSQTRMLASLEREGKVPGSVSAQRQPSRRKYGVAAVAVALAAGAGAYFALGSSDDATATVAAAAPAHVTPIRPAASAASAAVASASAASAASAQIELAAASAPVAASSATVALAQAPAASQVHVNPLDKLASNDVETVSAPTHSAKNDRAHAKEAVAAKPHAETVAVAAAKPAATAAHADTKSPAAPHKARKEDDADTELVAAIIARLDKRGAKPPLGAPGPAPVSEATPANIANQVHQCSSNTDLLEARQCRNRACEGHWGKVDACPAARAPKTSSNDGASNGKRG